MNQISARAGTPDRFKRLPCQHVSTLDHCSLPVMAFAFYMATGASFPLPSVPRYRT